MSIPQSTKEILKAGMFVIVGRTMCPFCDKTRSLLKSMGVKNKYYQADAEEWSEELVEDFHTLSKMRTYPKNFVGEICVGGYTELVNAQQSGELYKLFDDAGIKYQKPSF